MDRKKERLIKEQKQTKATTASATPPHLLCSYLIQPNHAIDDLALCTLDDLTHRAIYGSLLILSSSSSSK
jgi:hypothetical protein